MPVKITLAEVKKIVRKTMLQNIGITLFFLILGSGTSSIALQELLIIQYGWAVFAFALSIVFFLLGIYPIYLIITNHEIKITYTRGQLDFFADLELLKGNHITYHDFMDKHAGEVYDVNKIMTLELRKHEEATKNAESRWTSGDQKTTTPVPPPDSQNQTQQV